MDQPAVVAQRHRPQNTTATSVDQSPLLDATEIFSNAASKFQAELSDEERLQYEALNGPESLISTITQSIKRAERRHQSRLLSACSKINNFAQAVAPYFKVIDLIVSSHPEWAAIVWGAVHLVFLLSSHYVTFFERLADMFSKMAEHLPRYHRHLDMLKGRVKDGTWEAYHSRLATSLSLIYTDILQFCHDCRALFSSKRMGIRFKANLIMDLMWTPFDVRFSKIIERFREHRELFESGLDDAYREEMLMHYIAVEREIQHNSKTRRDNLKELLEKESKEIQSKKLALRQWIAAPDWRRIYDEACKQRHFDTGNWFLNHPVYRKWATYSAEFLGKPFAERVLIVSGKPGYGKTILSSLVIEDLEGQVSNPGCEHRVAFFHFSQKYAEISWRRAAFQSVLTQLVNKYGSRKEWIDIAAVIMNDTGSGQRFASEDDILSILNLYIKQLNVSYFVFDGLDECSDYEAFVKDLEIISADSNLKIVLFGRPHLRYPNISYRSQNRILLSAQENFDDLRKYIEPHILSLLDNDGIARKSNSDAGSMAHDLSNSASSIFLWAVLMVAYLKSPVLTPQERLDTISDITSFAGLDAMFTKILEQIERQVPKSHWKKILRIFQWLAVARQSLSVEEIHTALAVKRDTPIKQDDKIQNFVETLVQMSGSLVEVRSGVVGFIHLSIPEFLTTTSGRSPCSSPFLVQPHAAHCSLASTCLSYMLNDVPHGPLASYVPTSTALEVQKPDLPLLRYSAVNWAAHVSECLQFISVDHHSKFCDLNKLRYLFSQVSRFVDEKNLLAMWIEASWTFNTPPALGGLPDTINNTLDKLDIMPKENLGTLLAKLKTLSIDLLNLEQQWGRVLGGNPGEIWLSSISTFFKSEFLTENKATKLTSLGSPEDHGAVLLASQVSINGREVGVVKVLPPPIGKRIAISRCWLAVYQIWSLETMEEISSVRFELPTMPFSPGDRKDKTFRLPVAFSPSLKRVAIGDSLVQLKTRSGEESHPEFQTLEISSCHYFPVADQWPNSSQTKTKINRSIASKSDIQQYKHVRDSGNNHCCYWWYHYSFSPNEKYLLMIEGQGPPNIDVPGGPWILSVYENQELENNKLSFKLVALVGIILRVYRTTDWIDGSPMGSVSCFHPTEPVVAVVTSGFTSLWKFTENDHELDQLYPEPLAHMMFSECGNYLYGVTMLEGNPVFLHIEPYLSRTPNSNHATSDILVERHNQPSTALTSKPEIQPENALVSTKSRILSSVNMPIFTKHNGQLQLSALRHDNSKGEVTLTTKRADGTTIQETITRLPASSTLEQSYSTLVPTDNHKNLRVVLNMAAQESYSVDACAEEELVLPAVLDRQRQTIPVQHWKNAEKRNFAGLEGYQQTIDEYRPPSYKRLRNA